MSTAAQDTVDIAPAPSVRFPAAWYPPENDVTSTMAPVKGAPYEARLVMNPGRADMSKGQPLYARDSDGRTRTETVEGHLGADGKPVTVRAVEVNDAVTHCMFHWTEPWIDKRPPSATVSCMPRRLHYDAEPLWSSVMSMLTQLGAQHPSTTETDYNESLGVRMFGEVRAVGVRHTRTFPNGQPTDPKKLVTDFWVSPEMKEFVSMRVPPYGYTLELREIKLREPDARLFYPPDGYKIEPAPSSP